MEKTLQGVEVLGDINHLIDRPKITLENLDVSELTPNDIPEDGMFYDGICIPLKFNNADQLAWELVWYYFIAKYVDKNGEDDTIEDQPINIQLFIEDDQSTDKRKYMLSALIRIEDYEDGPCETEEIHLTSEEIEAVNKALSETTTYIKKKEPAINKPKLSLRELCDKYRNIPNKVTVVEPTAFDLYKELRNPNYKDFTIGKEVRAKEEVPAFGITCLKKIRYEKCWGTGADKLRFSDGKNWFLIYSKIESIEKTREFGNFCDTFKITFPDCEEPLELVANWIGNEVD